MSRQRQATFGVTSRKALRAERRSKAFNLLKKGYTVPEILKAIPSYKDKQRLEADLRQAITELGDRPAREYLALTVARYEALLKAVWEQAVSGDLKAHDAARQTIGEQVKVLGLGRASNHEDNTSDVASFIAFVTGNSESESDEIDDDWEDLR